MLEWIRRIFRESDDDKRQQFFEMMDSLNAEIHGGRPTLVERQLGHLKLRSRTLVLGDPQYLPSVEIPGFPADQVAISARMREYPDGAATVIQW